MDMWLRRYIKWKRAILQTTQQQIVSEKCEVLFIPGGIFISLVMKYLDNLCKSFASAMSIILVVMISHLIFHDVQLNLMFLTGSITVCGAVLLYSSVPEWIILSKNIFIVKDLKSPVVILIRENLLRNTQENYPNWFVPVCFTESRTFTSFEVVVQKIRKKKKVDCCTLYPYLHICIHIIYSECGLHKS